MTKEERVAYGASHYQKNKDKYRQALNDRRRKRTAWFLELKSKLACVKCGESHPACLSFHHRDPVEKVKDVGDMVNFAFAEKTILEEIAKCDPMCENCHRKLHWDERQQG